MEVYRALGQEKNKGGACLKSIWYMSAKQKNKYHKQA